MLLAQQSDTVDRNVSAKRAIEEVDVSSDDEFA